ncbi:MAG: glycosyl transferase family 39 [Chthoniobacterales bacterium]
MNLHQLATRYLLPVTIFFFTSSVYFYGLGSDHIATNGDELVYAQMTRATALSGHLLPLQAPIERLSNTKPPLLFWQGIASTSWAKNWSLWNLRYPNVIYTLLIALMLFLLGKKTTESLAGNFDTISSQNAAESHREKKGQGLLKLKQKRHENLGLSSGILAALIYLSFFGTFRYGRCFLTSAPEVFWLFLPFFILLQWPHLFRSWKVIPLLGLIIGIGLLYKSFALLAPLATALGWSYFHERNGNLRDWLKSDLGKIILLSLISLSVFSLWFFFDPNPKAIFNDFIWRENIGKFDAGNSHYLLNFFWGGSSIWRNVISYPLNAGILAPAVIALFVLAYLRSKSLMRAERLLWIWVATLFVVFSFPNQRDERYLLLGMPVLALLLAMNWELIPRWVMSISLTAVAIITLGLGGLAVLLQQHLATTSWGVYHYPAIYWLLIVATFDVAGVGLIKPQLTRAFLCPAILLLYLCYAAFLLPFDGPLGHFDQAARDAICDKKIWVPINFNAREESYRFLLPEARALIPYDYKNPPSQSTEAAKTDSKAFFTLKEMKIKVSRCIISLPLTDDSAENLQGAQILGRRLNLIDRFSAQETRDIMMGNVAKYLFHQDLLIERTQQ